MSVRHAAGPAERGPEVRPAAAAGVRVQDRRGLAAQRGAGLHHPAAPGARRAGRVRRPGGRRPRRVSDHSAGGRELAEWLHTPPGTVAPPRDELVIKVLVAISVPGVDVHDLIQVHRRHLVELMQHYTHVKAEPPTTTWSWPWSSTPSCSAWRRSCAGWTLPTPGLPASSGQLGRQAPRPGPTATIGGQAMTAMLELRQVSKVYGSGPSGCRPCMRST